MGLETVAIGAALGGGLLGAAGGAKAASNQNKRAAGISNAATGMMQNQPSVYEQYIQQMMGQPRDNTGNDALMQLLRADPTRQTSAVSDQLMQYLNPNSFNASPLFQSLDQLDQMGQRRAVASMQAGAGTLGQRYGSAMMDRTGQLMSQLTNEASARRNQLGLDIYNSGANRALGAAQTILGAQQSGVGNQLGIINALLNNQNSQFAQGLQLAQLGGGLQGQRLGQNAQLLGISAGVPTGGNPLQALGGGITDIGQLLLLKGIMGDK